MKLMLRATLYLVLAVTLAWPAALPAAAAPAPAVPAADGPNLLQNPGFESPYGKQCCQTDLSKYFPNTPIDEVQVAHGWLAWWLEPDQDPFHPSQCPGQSCTAWHRPEYREANCGDVCANRVRSGSNSQKYFTFYSVHDAGMYQQVGGIASGARVRFSIYMQGWSSSTDDATSVNPSPMGMRVGIDPFGGTNPYSANVIWTAPFDTYDAWGLYTIEAVARNSVVTVFTRSNPTWGVPHNDIYLDDASLVVVGAAPATGGGSPPPVPTAMPANGLKYVVQPGDNYYRISRRFGISLSAIYAANNVTNPNLLKVGTVLFLPGVVGPITGPAPTAVPGGPAPAPTPTTVNPASIPGAFQYTVVVGDNLYRLSVRFNTTIARIKELNKLVGDIIYIGQVLWIAP
jgi:LysM repeat protein